MHGRTFRNIWWIVLLCSVSLSTPVWGQPDAPPEKADPAETPKLSPAEITALVQRLGDDAHTERHEAADRLTALGVDAQDALMAGLDHEDPEVRRRCRWILGDVLQADFERRLAAFLADKENRQDHNLPGWERFSGMIGHDGPARELFAAMQKAESGLLTSATAGQSAAAESVRLRFRQVFQMLSVRDASLRRAPSLGTVAALVFVLADKELDLPADLVDSPYLSTVVQQPAFQKALAEGPAKDAVRKLLGQWILRPSGINLLTTKLRMSTQFKIADGLQLACRVVRNRKEVSPYLRVYAISTLGSLGGKQYAAMMTELLEDESECHRRTVNGKQLSIEIRDVALGWLIHITGQKHADYGQNQAKTVFDRLKTSPTYHISASYMVFDDPKKRDEALAKWKAWVAKNPLPELPPEAKPEDPPVPAIAVRTNPVRAMNPLGGIAKPGNEDPMDWLGGLGLEMADRIQVRYLTTARELYRQKRYLEAIRLLGNILAARSDRLFQPDLKVQLFRCLKPEAEQLIETLPAEGRKAYRLLFEAEASRQLAEAVETGDLEQLARVAECFFHTPPGADATYLLAMHQIDRDDPFRAAMYLQRLRSRSRDADRFEPMLTLQLAACWARAEAREPADRVLRELKARQGGKPVLVAGEPRELFAGADEAMDWLEAIVGPLPPGRVGDGWPMFRGAPSRNLPANSGSPYLETDVLVPDCEDPTVGKTVTQLRKQIHDDHRAVLPSAHPLVVGQTIVLRTATHVRAVDFTSGRVLWEAPTEDTLRHFLGHENEETKKGQAEALARGLRRRLWNDATFGTLSSDGRLVFAVEDLAFGFGADYQRMRVTSDGQRQLDPDWIKQSNLLAAYDLATGKVQWEIGSLSEPAEEDRPSTFFLGPPLPLGRRLYVVAESAGSVRLMELDGETGRRIWELALDRREPGLPLSMSTRMPLAMLQSSAHRSGACPSYADGVLVCRTSARRFVAVELTTRAVRWIFETPDPELPPGMNRGFGNVLQRKLYEATTNADQNRWADSSVTIAQQRVLLAPAGSDRLLCLNLTDGRLLWSIPRADGLYVGGVHADSAIVVGRGSLWAVNMADGSPAWTDGAIALPAGALPSGRGFLSDEHYHVPLSTAEVVSVDLTTGTLTSRSRSPSGIVPGNLVACRDVVLSQHVDGLRRFESLPERRQRSVAALDRLPDDPEALTDCGEVLLYEGQISEAIDYLRRAMDIRPTDRTRRVLTDALIEGLRVDFATFRDRADEMEPLIDDPASRARFLHALARALHQAGLASDAMETYLKLIDLDQQPPELEHVEAARTVRRDRLIAACVAQLRNEATPADLALIDALIAARRIDGRLPAFLSYFPTHPQAEEARSRLAAELRKKKEWFAAEQMLTTLRGSDDPARRREAVARLAQLWREAGKPERTVALHGELAGALADEICLDGKTGRQLAEALAADERIGKLVNVPDPWPIEPVVAVAKDVKSSVTMRYPISLTDAAGRFPTELYATIDSQGQHIVGSDRLGRQTWDLDLGTRKHQWSTSSVVYSYSRGWINGNLLIAWVGNRICAIESSSSEAKLLWTRELITSPPPYPGFGMMLPARMRRVRQGDGFPGKEPSPLAATPQTVCFQQDRKLTAVDPVSGQLLWTRDDLDAESDLFGDRYRLFVTSPAAGEEPEAVVLSMLDGRELGRRKVPKLSRRVATVGGYVVTWESDAQQTRAAMVDPWNNQTVWEHAFEPTAKAWLTGGDELAVLDPKGRLIILALADGSPILQTDLDLGPLEEQERRKKLKELEEQEGLEEQERLKKQKEIEDQKGLDGLEKLVVLRQADRYLVLACVPKPAGVMAMTQNLPNNVAVHGAMYGIRRADGKMLWKADVENQTVNLGQPADLPLIVLLNYVYERKGTSTKRFHKVCCIDTRTGRLEYDAQIEGHSTSICRIDAKPAESQIVIQTYRQTINVAFGPKAAQRMKVAKEAAAKAEAEKQEAAKKEAEAKAEAPKEEAEVKVATVKKEVKPETAEKPAPK